MNLPVDLAAASREELEELIEVVGQLLSYIGTLEARIAELEGQAKPPTGGLKPGLKQGTPPAWVKANRPARAKKERRKRTHGFARRREEPTHKVEHVTASCPDCQAPLQGGMVRRRRQVISLPRVRAKVTEHVVLERACPKCRKRWAPNPDWSAITVGRQRFGISVQSEVSVLREECRLPFRVIQGYPRSSRGQALKWRFGLGLSVGQIVALTRGVAQRGREEYARLQEEIRAGPVVYGDETGWREDGLGGCLWSFSTPKVRCFLHRWSRSRHVVEEALGDKFEGALVSGFYGAYNVYQGPHQRCWTHPVSSTGQALLRDIHQLKERFPEHDGLAQWSRRVREVYDQAQAYSGPGPGLPETVRRSRRVKQQRRFQKQLWSICQPYLGGDTPMRVLCQSVERFLPELFTFIVEPRAGADNNPAERSLRPPVVSRKISGGTRSAQGSETKSIMASLFGTWRLQGRNPCHALNSILSQPISAPV